MAVRLHYALGLMACVAERGKFGLEEKERDHEIPVREKGRDRW